MILHIDTKNQKVIKIEIRHKGKVISEVSQKNEYGSQVLLPLIIKLMQNALTNHLKTNHLKNPQVSIQIHPKGGHWRKLEGIEVETGPGSFTGLRVGVSVANALGFALGIPVNGKRLETKLAY